MNDSPLARETHERLERAVNAARERQAAIREPRNLGGVYQGADRNALFVGTDLDANVIESQARAVAADGIAALRAGVADSMQVLAGLWVDGIRIGILLAEQNRDR